MKTYGNLFEEVYQFDQLHEAYLRARAGKRQRADVLLFERNLEGELIQLQNELIWGQYRTGEYRTFYVLEPKRRLVAALPFRDRVVQHALISILNPIWEKRFIHHSYACRPGRGMHKGADQAQAWLREVQRQHGLVYCLKADIRRYFPSINHEIMIGLLERRIACPRTINLCRDIMASWQPGLPIGNLTSQLWANIYLHELDIFVKQNLGIKRYVRYMDDFVIVHHDKVFLQDLLEIIAHWLWDVLRLKLNNKTQIFPVSIQHGRALDFLGYRMWTTHRRLR
ncbi:MAG: reverse transcriptase/maturase family protein, partial [Tenuifilaceae bacterium]|nr:reverse transcriptase/maturase family protein [Tenuifilaceae bacterium]